VGRTFVPLVPAKPVAQLAAEAGIEGHADVGIDRIGASLPCQHWNKGGETNDVKEALKAGKADVLTLATRERAPDECIPKFVKLGVSLVSVMISNPFNPSLSANQTDKCMYLEWQC
jgi:hypothetical protein